MPSLHFGPHLDPMALEDPGAVLRAGAARVKK
jgi:hypothetical protein